MKGMVGDPRMLATIQRIVLLKGEKNSLGSLWKFSLLLLYVYLIFTKFEALLLKYNNLTHFIHDGLTLSLAERCINIYMYINIIQKKSRHRKDDKLNRRILVVTAVKTSIRRKDQSKFNDIGTYFLTLQLSTLIYKKYGDMNLIFHKGLQNEKF